MSKFNEKEIQQWDTYLADKRKKDGIITYRAKNEKGTIRIENYTGKCKICEKETHYLIFLDKYNQGTGLCVCKECLKEAIKILEEK